MRKAIAEVFGPEKFVEVSALAGTVHALSTLCLQRPRIHTEPREGEENLCPFCIGDDTLRPADRLHSLHSIGTPRTHVNMVHLSATTSPGPIKHPRAPSIGVISTNVVSRAKFYMTANGVWVDGAVLYFARRSRTYWYQLCPQWQRFRASGLQYC